MSMYIYMNSQKKQVSRILKITVLILCLLPALPQVLAFPPCPPSSPQFPPTPPFPPSHHFPHILPHHFRFRKRRHHSSATSVPTTSRRRVKSTIRSWKTRNSVGISRYIVEKREHLRGSIWQIDKYVLIGIGLNKSKSF